MDEFEAAAACAMVYQLEEVSLFLLVLRFKPSRGFYKLSWFHLQSIEWTGIRNCGTDKQRTFSEFEAGESIEEDCQEVILSVSAYTGKWW